MFHSSTKFTDHNLKLFYGSLLIHYQQCMQKHSQNVVAIYNEMYLAVQYAVESPLGSLYNLEAGEKCKVYSAFNAIFYALPVYRNMPPQQKTAFNPSTPAFNEHTPYCINNYNNYDCYHWTSFDWLLLSTITHDSHSHAHHFSHGGRCWPSHQHGHGSSSTNDEDCMKLIAILILAALAAFAVVLTCIALYYMLDEFANSLERIWYNEGWLKAALMLASSVAFGSGAAMLSLTFAAAPLIALAVAASINPVGVVIAATILLGFIGAGVGCFAMGFLYDSIDEKVNQDAIDPADSERFRLTAAEEHSLKNKGIDPIKVKCAIVALRGEMASLLGNAKPIPSFFTRHSSDGAEIQKLLQKVRDLRRGKIDTVEVGRLFFDCKMPQEVYQYSPHTFYSGAVLPPPYEAPSSLPPEIVYGY